MDRDPLKIVESDIDQYGHVNYKSFLAILEQAQNAFMGRRLIGFEEIERRWGLRSLVKTQTVTYYTPLHLGEDAKADTTVKLGHTSITFSQVVTARDQLVAVLTMVVVFVNKEGFKTLIPDELRALFSFI